MQALGKVCTACGTERKKKGAILYRTTDFMPFCNSPYFCNDDHPHSPKNTHLAGVEGREIDTLVDFETASGLYSQWLDRHHSDPSKIQKVKNMITRPISIRIASPELAMFILELQDEFNIGSVSDTIRYCVQQMKEAKGTFYHDQKELAARFEDDKKLHEGIKSVTEEKQPDELPSDFGFEL